MKIKTSELTGAAINWAVAKCEGLCEGDFAWYYDRRDTFKYSIDWSQGGPIIEREGMHVDCLRVADHYRPAIWEAWPYATGTKHIMQGPTPLIAAMRCFVASKLGDEVDVPSDIYCQPTPNT